METSKGYCKPYSVFPSMDSLTFFYDYQPFKGHEFKFKSPITENRIIHNGGRNMEKKRKLTSKELDFLEKNFNEEMKLEPEKKMKLSIALGIEPRQVAVWFQNRRARWKNKQLEQAYDALKQEFETVSKEKRDLQEEILRLKAELEDRTTNKYGMDMYAEEETAESTVMVNGRTKNHQLRYHAVAESSYLLHVEDRNPNSLSGSDWIFWSNDS